MQKNRKHISFSEIKIWNECPHKHKLLYIDNLKLFKGNEYTAFGKAIHAVSENFLVDPPSESPSDFFEKEFLKELRSLSDDNPDLVLRADMVKDMRAQGKLLAPLIIPALKEHFDEYDVFSVEEELYQEISNDKKYKGFVDLVLKKDEEYHIIDWKSCSWGWDARRRTDRMTTYQLAYYKNFFCEKHNVDPKNVKVYFGLLKRTAKKNHVEIFDVTCGDKKIKNSLKLMEHALYNIDKKNFVKNRLSCHSKFGPCEFFQTEHCKR